MFFFRNKKEILKVVSDVCNRWNSTYLMFERMLRIRESVNYALLTHKPVSKSLDNISFHLILNLFIFVIVILERL